MGKTKLTYHIYGGDKKSGGIRDFIINLRGMPDTQGKVCLVGVSKFAMDMNNADYDNQNISMMNLCWDWVASNTYTTRNGGTVSPILASMPYTFASYHRGVDGVDDPDQQVEHPFIYQENRDLREYGVVCSCPLGNAIRFYLTKRDLTNATFAGEDMTFTLEICIFDTREDFNKFMDKY